MPFSAESESSSISDNGSDTELRALEMSLHQQYTELPATHEAHAHLEHVTDGLEEQVPTLPGFEPFVGRKEFAEFIDVSEQLVYRYQDIVLRYGANEALIKESPQWEALHATTAQFDEKVADLSWDTMTASDADALFKAIFLIQGEVETFSGGKESLQIAGAPSISTVLESRRVPSDLIQEVYWLKPERTSKHHSGRSFLANLATSDLMSLQSRVIVATSAYRNKESTDFIEQGADPLIDKLRREIGTYPFAEYELKNAAPIEMSPEGIAQYESETRQRIRYMLEWSGLSEKATAQYMQALLNRALVKQKDGVDASIPYISGAVIADEIKETRILAKKASPELLNILSEDLGVVNFDRYNERTINNLKSLIGSDARAIDTREEMRERGVTVVFSTAYSDHNNAFENIGDMYSREDAHTLLFEVSQPSDFYRRLLLLKKHGIKATTIVIAAHGMPGATEFSDGVDMFYLFSETAGRDATSKNLDTQIDKVNLARVVGDEFMIDDEHGERRIILHNCSSAAERDDGASVAQTFLKRAARMNLKVIGASDVMAAGHDRSENRVRFANFADIEARGLSAHDAVSAGIELSLDNYSTPLSRKERVMTRLGLRAVEQPRTIVRTREIEGFEPVRRASTIKEKADV